MPTSPNKHTHLSENLGILALLGLRGFPTGTRAKFVRHKSQQDDIPDLIRRGYFDEYQATQKKPIFDDLDYIITFLGETGTRACFYGVYSVGQRQALKAGMLPLECPFRDLEDKGDHHFYLLKRDERFNLYKGRLVVEWGPMAIRWHQSASAATDKAVFEFRPRGRLLEPFDDYLGFTLSYEELKHLVSNSEAHRDWKSRLSAVAGVYLMLDSKTGLQYVGSAYGAEGVWGRWSEYARNPDGGNKALEELLEKNSGEKYEKHFRYSLLQILPLSYSADRVIAVEEMYKAKLGSRATGLNFPEYKLACRDGAHVGF